MINRGGENVYSIEVENAVGGVPGVAEAAVVGVPDEMMGENFGAVIVTAPGQELRRRRRRSSIARAAGRLQGSPVRGRAQRAAAAQPRRQDAQGQLREEIEWGDPLR